MDTVWTTLIEIVEALFPKNMARSLRLFFAGFFTCLVVEGLFFGMFIGMIQILRWFFLS